MGNGLGGDLFHLTSHRNNMDAKGNNPFCLLLNFGVLRGSSMANSTLHIVSLALSKVVAAITR